MADQGTKEIDDLIDGLREADFQVVHLGSRFRVTNPAGGPPAFIPSRIPRGGNIKFVLRELVNIGFDETVVAEAKERKRKERLDADRKAAERVLAQAKAKAASNGNVGHHRAQAAVERGIELAGVEGALELEDHLTDPAPASPATIEPRTTIVQLTPDLAAELLTHNRMYDPARKGVFDWTNRKLSQEKAYEYRDAMLRGEWELLTHQGMALDTELTLLDGQHRLIALVLAGQINPDIEIPMMVTYDLSPEIIDRIDTGLRRTVAGALTMHGEKETTALASIVRLVVVYDEVPWNNKRIVTTTETRQFIAAEPKVRDAARIVQGWASNQRLVLISALGAALHIIARHAGLDAAVLFLRAVVYGEGLAGERDPAHACRNALINLAANRRAKRDQTLQLALLIKTWNLRKAGKERTIVRWTSTEPFPRVES